MVLPLSRDAELGLEWPGTGLFIPDRPTIAGAAAGRRPPKSTPSPVPLSPRGQALQRAVQVPSALIVALNGLVVVFVVAADRYRVKLLSTDGRDEQIVDEGSMPGGDAATALGAVYDPAPSGTHSFDPEDSS